MAKAKKSNKKAAKKNENPFESNLLVFSVQEGENEGIKQLPKANNDTGSSGQIEKGKAQKVREKWSRADLINARGVWVNTFLLFGTIGALFYSQWSLNQAKRFFATENRPYLQVQDFKISGDTVYYSIENLGAYPAKIKSGTIAVIRQDAGLEKYVMPDTINGGAVNIFPGVINKYVVRNFPVKLTAKKKPIEPVRWGNPADYFMGKINYTDESNGNKREYFFTIRLTDFQFVVNDNY